MKAARLFGIALALSFVTACGDHSPTAVPETSSEGPDASLIGALLGPTGLLKCSNLPYDSTTVTIGPAGGRISAGPHTLFVPQGALREPTAITMVLPTGQGVNAVRFSPEGLEFERSALLNMSYANCNLLGRLLPKRIAYTSPNLDILYYLLSIDNIFSKRVTGRVDHFSDYVVAW